MVDFVAEIYAVVAVNFPGAAVDSSEQSFVASGLGETSVEGSNFALDLASDSCATAQAVIRLASTTHNIKRFRFFINLLL